MLSLLVIAILQLLQSLTLIVLTYSCDKTSICSSVLYEILSIKYILNYSVREDVDNIVCSLKKRLFHHKVHIKQFIKIQRSYMLEDFLSFLIMFFSPLNFICMSCRHNNRFGFDNIRRVFYI